MIDWKKSDLIATLALVISFISTGFAFYQWWTNEQTEHVHATIDVSNKYISQWRNIEGLRGELKTGQIGLEALEQIRRQNALLEYIAYLANKGNLDVGYLSNLIICDIITTADSTPNSEAAKFKARYYLEECQKTNDGAASDDLDNSK